MKRQSNGRHILFFCKYKMHAAFEKLAGMTEYARKRNCSVRFINYGPLTQPVEAYIACWNPVGIVSDTPRYRTPPRNRKCPTVFLDVERTLLRRGDTDIQYDSRDAGRIAAEEFIREGATNFGFIGSFEPRYWSDERRDSFCRVVEAHGGTVCEYKGTRSFGDVLAAQNDIRKWITELPKPCGIFAANDVCADYVLGTCQVMGVSVPEEIAVIGVDNDTAICENAFQTLSSIEIDFRRAGTLAIEALVALREGKRPKTTKFGSLRFVRRDSSKMKRNVDFSTRRMLEFIRAEACKGLKAKDVIARQNCPRRTVEARFRAATGQSILQAIEEVRYERAIELLKQKRRSVTEIATDCGFTSAADFSRFFKRHTGLSPRAWKKT